MLLNNKLVNSSFTTSVSLHFITFTEVFASSVLLSDDENSAYFMARGCHFGQNLLEDLPPGTCMELRLLTLGDSQQPSYELLNEDDNSDKSHL